MHPKHILPSGKSAPRTLMLWKPSSDWLVSHDVRRYAVATVEVSNSKVTSIDMLGGGERSSDLRYEFWQLLVEQMLCHPKFGYVQLPEPNPIRTHLNAMGISDTFIDAVHRALSTERRVELVLIVWSLKPCVWRQQATHCDLRQLTG